MGTTDNESAFNVSDVMTKFEQRRKEKAEKALANKDIVFKALKKLKIKEIELDYAGSGDSGDFHDPHVVDEKLVKKHKDGKIEWDDYQKARSAKDAVLEKNTVTIRVENGVWVDGKWDENVKDKEMSLKQAITEIAYDLLEKEHPGWEINDGSDGTFTLDVNEGVIRLSHTSYYTESDCTETEF